MNRKDILQQLAAGEITREEAEQRLTELGNPVPKTIATPPSTTNKGSSTGCLIIAIIIGVILLVLCGLFVGFLLFLKPRVVEPYEHNMMHHGSSMHGEIRINGKSVYPNNHGSTITINGKPVRANDHGTTVTINGKRVSGGGGNWTGIESAITSDPDAPANPTAEAEPDRPIDPIPLASDDEEGEQ